LLGAFARESTISITHTKCSAPGSEVPPFALRLLEAAVSKKRFFENLSKRAIPLNTEEKNYGKTPSF
jgi:hypothetical protein